MRSCAPIALLLTLLAAPLARAAMDSPGHMSFDFLAEEELVYEGPGDLPDDAPFVEGWAEAYISSDASEFGEDGAFIWGGLELSGPEGSRYGMLLMDLDLKRAPLNGEVMPHSAVRAEYLEKSGNDLLFSGVVSSGDVRIVDLLFHPGDDGAVEGRFLFFFADPDGLYPGCRVLTNGVFSSDPSPARMREVHHLPPLEPDGSNIYVGVDCYGAVYESEDESGGCGGDDESSGCEGDTADDTPSSCEGDGTAESGCEGGGEASGGCEGDSGGADCGDCGSASAATIAPPGAGRYRSGGPLRGFMRFLPEIVTLLFIGMWRRRP